MNPVRFSKALNRFLFSARQMSLLPGYGWNDGGCWTLAEALCRWAPEDLELYGVWKDIAGTPKVQHLVARIKETSNNYHVLFIDADGVMNGAQLIEWKMADKEMCPHCYIAPVTGSQIIEQNEIEFLDGVAQTLSDRLLKKFGSFKTALS